MNNNAANRSDVQEGQSVTERPSLQNTQEIKRTKRKKASRACFHCQKAHLTCDDSRPCQRCIKRGLAVSCQDGVRKKAKYLQDIDDEKRNLEMARANSPKTVEHRSISSPILSQQTALVSADQARTSVDNNVHLASVSRPIKTMHGTQDNGFGVMGDNLLFDYPMLSSYDFDSKAANMEYSMISNMLGSVTTPGTDYGLSPDTGAFTSPGINNLHRSMPSRQHTITPDQASIASESSWSQMPMASAPATKHPIIPSTQNPTNAQNHRVSNSTSLSTVDDLVPKTTSPGVSSVPPVVPSIGRQNGQYVDPHGQRPTPVARRPHAALREGQESIYKAIVKPFSYTNGYHLLNTYLRARFEKEDLLRIARAIVGYRPSFIALTKTLKEEDLTFMEVCFQRTLLEYEKFVGYSGTPTIIWRRTGQIELVGKEFCLLTQWSREQLLSKQTFIVELMDDSSVVEYFEKFSAHAFGDTSSVQTTCVLMTPQKRAVPCAFCFTIKRDVFDIPMMIVGNFLPVL